MPLEVTEMCIVMVYIYTLEQNTKYGYKEDNPTHLSTQRFQNFEHSERWC